MKYFFNFCHCSRTVGFGISAIFVKARLPARLFRRYVHIPDLSSFRTKSSGSLRPGRRTSNYEGGGIGACSVGTYRKDFSVTFLQRRAKGIAPAFGDWRVEPLADLCLFATDDVRASRRGFGNIYPVRVQSHSHLHPIACNTLR